MSIKIDINVAPTRRSECPCGNCSDRYLACHDHCGKYQEFKKLVKARQEAKKTDKLKAEYVHQRLLTTQPGKRKKKGYGYHNYY